MNKWIKPQQQNQIRWSGRVGRSILRFCRFCLTQNRWSSAPTDLLPEQIRRSGQNRSWYLICYQTRWLRSSKARLSSSSFALPRSLLPFWIGAIFSTFLELWSFQRFNQLLLMQPTTNAKWSLNRRDNNSLRQDPPWGYFSHLWS